MKEFSSERIEETRKYLESQRFPVEKVQLGGLELSYWVLPQAVNPKLPDFAFRMTRTDPETSEVSGIFGISDSVPSQLRPYWAAHEIIEFTQIRISQKDRCAEAERRVSELLPPQLVDEFIDRRIIFFRNLQRYFEGEISQGNEDYSTDDVAEATGAITMLVSLQGLRRIEQRINVNKKGNDQGFIEISAPEELGEGQNFFDQPPFSGIINSLSIKYGKPLTYVRSAVSLVAKTYEFVGDKPLTYKQLFYANEAVKRAIQNISRLKHKHKDLKDKLNAAKDKLEFLEITEELIDSLSPYPLWYSYVSSQRDQNFYEENGEYHPEEQPTRYEASPTKSYASWITEFLNTRKNLVLYGIHEVFPKEKDEEVSPVAQSSGHKREWKKWKILKAAELSK